MIDLITPDWPAPANIKAGTTTRKGGTSIAPFDSLNLGDHVGDNVQHVQHNRQLVHKTLNLPSDPFWLQQIHGNDIICMDNKVSSNCGDGVFTTHSQKVCVILTADCLPLLITNEEGSLVMALHVGWRGLSLNIVEKGIQLCQPYSSKLMAWMGPAIGQASYEVGSEMREVFIQHHPQASLAFQPTESGKWLASLYLLCRQRLEQLNIPVYGGKYDTYSESNCFFSYRRESKTGRMATLIWMT